MLPPPPPPPLEDPELDEEGGLLLETCCGWYAQDWVSCGEPPAHPSGKDDMVVRD